MRIRNTPIPLIDIFAGPGGLGEGFSAYRPRGESAFKSKLSIEKEESAHRTLALRSFFRLFPHRRAPQAYYDYLAKRITLDELYGQYPEEAKHAAKEAWCHTLAQESVGKVRQRLRQLIEPHDPWVLLGGPPCQPFSLAGRSRNAPGSKTKYSDGQETRHTLYLEYLQIIADFSPAVFVMENVRGLLSARYQGVRMFDRIIEDLQHPDVAIRQAGRNRMRGACKGVTYTLHAIGASDSDQMFDEPDFLVRTERHGIPQARHRVIVIGVRDDVGQAPQPLAIQDPVPSRAVLDGLPPLRSGLTPQREDSRAAWERHLLNSRDTPWLQQIKSKEPGVHAVIKRTLNSLSYPAADRGDEYVTCSAAPAYQPKWYVDKRIPSSGICNHAARGHMPSDLYRYLFAAAYAQVHEYSPKLVDFPVDLLPAHENAKSPDKNTKFADRFRVQLSGKPSTTIVSHISKDGHYYIHPDPSQCRSLTVREAARLQTFPDNYRFVGNRTQQYHQVGNAVPPLLAHQIADIVHALFTESGLA